jgi:plasmid replication initiation protein
MQVDENILKEMLEVDNIQHITIHTTDMYNRPLRKADWFIIVNIVEDKEFKFPFIKWTDYIDFLLGKLLS